MTEESKAEELIEKFYDLDQYNKTPIKYCKQCAIICCNEILNGFNRQSTAIGFPSSKLVGDRNYWLRVKEILNTL